MGGGACLLLCPYLEGSDEAPATANRGEEKKVLSATSMSVARFCPLVVGICELMDREVNVVGQGEMRCR